MMSEIRSGVCPYCGAPYGIGTPPCCDALKAASRLISDAIDDDPGEDGELLYSVTPEGSAYLGGMPAVAALERRLQQAGGEEGKSYLLVRDDDPDIVRRRRSFFLASITVDYGWSLEQVERVIRGTLISYFPEATVAVRRTEDVLGADWMMPQ